VIIKVQVPEGEQLLGEGTVICWKIKEGDTVLKGDILAEIETPKAVVELESPAAGVVSRLLVRDGDAFPLQEPLAMIEQGAEGEDRPDKSAGETAGTGETQSGRPPAESAGPRIPASPAARRLARERGLELAGISGSGPGGRILESDVLARAGAEPGTDVPGRPSDAGERIVPLSPMRRAIAGKLSISKQSIPHFYLTVEVDAAALWEAYTKIKSTREVSLNDFIIRASASALKEFPGINSRLEGDRQVFKQEINIGIAVHVADGLRIPVLRAADRLSLGEISLAAAELVRRAREGRVEGAGAGTFTISNLGMFGVSEFAAVINPPEVAVLAVGQVREAAVVRNGVVSAGRTLSLTLSGDHRAFDGVTGACFLRRVKQILEAPESRDQA
jgi:pyruvate dehydrogenase E2 component (dihydrolipoamide acetyltransferase)